MAALRIYYAHPMSWYNTSDEAEDVALLSEYGKVINPNSDEFNQMVQRAKRNNYPVMQIFADYIKDKVDVVAFRAFYDGRIGAGVAREVFEARIWYKEVWKVVGSSLAGSLKIKKYSLQRSGLNLYSDTLPVRDTSDRIINQRM